MNEEAMIAKTGRGGSKKFYTDMSNLLASSQLVGNSYSKSLCSTVHVFQIDVSSILISNINIIHRKFLICCYQSRFFAETYSIISPANVFGGPDYEAVFKTFY